MLPPPSGETLLLMSELDTNQDGVLSHQELKEGVPVNRAAKRAMAKKRRKKKVIVVSNSKPRENG